MASAERCMIGAHAAVSAPFSPRAQHCARQLAPDTSKPASCIIPCALRPHFMSQTAAQEIQNLFGAHIEAVSQPKGMASQRRSPTREASFMLYMNTRGITIMHQGPLQHGPGLAQAQGGGQTQPIASSHPYHWPPLSHEGEDEDGPARGDPPNLGKTYVDHTIQPTGLGLHDLERRQGGAGSRCAEAAAAPCTTKRSAPFSASSS